MTRRRFSRLSRFSYANALNLDIRRGTIVRLRNENGRPGADNTRPPRVRNGPPRARRITPVSANTHGRFTMKNTLPEAGCLPGPRAPALSSPSQPVAPIRETMRKGGEL
jgi:hypothetical protein